MSDKKKPFPEQEVFDHHPSQDRTDRHPTDAVLREYGFKIHSRKGDQEPEWERRGIIMKQSIAIEIIYRERNNK